MQVPPIRARAGAVNRSSLIGQGESCCIKDSLECPEEKYEGLGSGDRARLISYRSQHDGSSPNAI